MARRDGRAGSGSFRLEEPQSRAPDSMGSPGAGGLRRRLRGGAHRDPEIVAAAIKNQIVKDIELLNSMSCDALLEQRYQKFRKIGVFEEKVSVQ